MLLGKPRKKLFDLPAGELTRGFELRDYSKKNLIFIPVASGATF
jgi:hypothetical protein